jgi:hypothetical protein
MIGLRCMGRRLRAGRRHGKSRIRDYHGISWLILCVGPLGRLSAPYLLKFPFGGFTTTLFATSVNLVIIASESKDQKIEAHSGRRRKIWRHNLINVLGGGGGGERSRGREVQTLFRSAAARSAPSAANNNTLFQLCGG